jgi:hypothetical protein
MMTWIRSDREIVARAYELLKDDNLVWSDDFEAIRQDLMLVLRHESRQKTPMPTVVVLSKTLADLEPLKG